MAEFVETTSNPPLGLDRILDFPSVAVDRSAGPNRGNLYVAFEEADRDVRDIKLARSTNGGRDFEPAIRVNDDPPGADQFFPWVAVDPTDGQISVVSYDRRRHPRLALTDVFLSQSNDGGLTFVPGVALTDRASSFIVNADARPVFGDYINVTADGKAIYATWADGRNGDPDVFFARFKKVATPFVLLRSSSLDDSTPSGDGDGAPEPGEQPRLKVALANVGSGAATGVSATLRTNTPGVTVSQSTSRYPDLSGRGSVIAARALYQFRVDPSLTCSKTVVCSPITTQLYGVDPLAGTIVRFGFDTGTSGSVPARGDTPSGGPDGLAVKSPTDAFWVNGFGLDLIFEFNPMTGELIETGPFPIRSPGVPMCTDALALVSPNRLFTQNFCEGKLYEVDTTTGLIVNASLPGGLGVVGGLAGGAGRLFATLGLRAIAELDPDSGGVLNEFAVLDLSGDGAPDRVFGLAFDGTYLFAASVDADPPNVMALDPATGGLLGVSPFVTSRRLSALDAVAAPLGEVCKAGTFRSMIDFDLDITTDQGTFSSSLSIPLGREAKTTAFRDDVEAGVNGWTAAGEWHQATGRSVGAGHSWYFGRENGPPLGNAYDNNAAGDLTSPPFNLSGASSAELVFDTYLARVGMDRGFGALVGSSPADDVADPIGCDLRIYEQCAAEIEAAVTSRRLLESGPSRCGSPSCLTRASPSRVGTWTTSVSSR